MRADERALADLAASVADGEPVDWAAVDARSDARARRLTSQLRLVESIASLHRSIPAEDSDLVHAIGGSPRAVAAEPEGRRWGRLVILEQIGRGVSADVFRAWDTELRSEERRVGKACRARG